ncbi:MAG TPA: DUF6807 family protein, partial [Planctomycetota bacterium]
NGVLEMMMLLLALQIEVTADAVTWKDGLRYERTKAVGQSACYFHPLSSPKGVELTEVAPKDHPHHRGIFFGWVETHGAKDADFWGWGQPAPIKDRRVVNRDAKVEGDSVLIANEWVAEDVVIAREKIRARLHAKDGIRILDLEIALEVDARLTVAKWAFSGFAVRARKDGIKTVEGPAGAVDLKAPSHVKPESNWPAAAWYGFQYESAGIALAAAPSPWHVVKGIGLLNPAPQSAGPLVIEPGAPFKLSYRVLTWDGPTPREALNALVTK